MHHKICHPTGGGDSVWVLAASEVQGRRGIPKWLDCYALSRRFWFSSVYRIQEETSRERSAASVIPWTHPSQQEQSKPELMPRWFWRYCVTEMSDGPWKTRCLLFSTESCNIIPAELCAFHYKQYHVPFEPSAVLIWWLTPLYSFPNYFLGFLHTAFDLQHSQLLAGVGIVMQRPLLTSVSTPTDVRSIWLNFVWQAFWPVNILGLLPSHRFTRTIPNTPGSVLGVV